MGTEMQYVNLVFGTVKTHNYAMTIQYNIIR